jgi:enamine deaminase RidA (YjgF/YER057c/UK114 family)
MQALAAQELTARPTFLAARPGLIAQAPRSTVAMGQAAAEPALRPRRETLMKTFALAAAFAVGLAGAAQAQNLHVNPQNGFIAQAVKVPAGSEMLYVSGITPDTVAGAPAATPFGDTRAQTLSVLGKIGAILKGQGYGFEDVVMMRVLLVGDPAKGGGMDFAGMMEGYNQVFGAQKNKPARITSQVAALVRPGMFVEIEVQAARKP